MHRLEISKLQAETWNKLTAAEKEPYLKMYEEDRIRYRKEMKAFNEKGCFVNSDGKTSTFIFRKPNIGK